MRTDLTCPNCGENKAEFVDEKLVCAHCYASVAWHHVLASLCQYTIPYTANNKYLIEFEDFTFGSIDLYDNNTFVLESLAPSELRALVKLIEKTFGAKVLIRQTGIDPEMRGCSVCGEKLTLGKHSQFYCSVNNEHYVVKSIAAYYGSHLKSHYSSANLSYFIRENEINVSIEKIIMVPLRRQSFFYRGPISEEKKEVVSFSIEVRHDPKNKENIVLAVPRGLQLEISGITDFLKRLTPNNIRVVIVK